MLAVLVILAVNFACLAFSTYIYKHKCVRDPILMRIYIVLLYIAHLG